MQHAYRIEQKKDRSKGKWRLVQLRDSDQKQQEKMELQGYKKGR